MKRKFFKIIILLILAAFNYNAIAAHINGYETNLHNVKDANGNATNKYYFELKVYNSIFLGIPTKYVFDVYRYYNNTNTKRTTLDFNRVKIDTIKQIGSCTPDVAYSYYFVATYRSAEFFDFNYNDNLGVYYLYEEVPFSSAINYLNLSYVPIILEFNKLTNVRNTSPSFKYPPAVYYYIGEEVQEDWSVQEPDGDSIRYSLVQAREDFNSMPFTYNTFANGYSLDSNIASGDPDVTIDQKGIMHYRPMQMGDFIVSVKIEEFRWDPVDSVWNKLTEMVSDRLMSCYLFSPIDHAPVLTWNSSGFYPTDTIRTEYLKQDTLEVNVDIKDSSDNVVLIIENISGINKDFRIDTSKLDSGIIEIGKSGLSFNDFKLIVQDSLHLKFRYIVDTTFAINKPYQFSYLVIDSSICDRVQFDTIVHTLSILKERCYSKETLYENVCDSVYIFNGVKLYESGFYTDTLQNQFFCDSIVSISLLIQPKIDSFEISGNELISDTSIHYTYSVPFQEGAVVDWHLSGGIIADTISYTSIEVKWFNSSTARIECKLSNLVCEFRDQKIVKIEHLVGIENNPIRLSIYPNPSQDYLNIVCEQFLSAEIFDIMGKKMMHSNSSVLDVTKLENGLYLLNVTTANGQVYSKFMKQ